MIPLQIGADMAFRAHEQLQLLADDSRPRIMLAVVLHARRRCRRLDAVCAADAADGPVDGSGIFAMHILGASSIMGSINIIVTILNMRAPA